MISTKAKISDKNIDSKLLNTFFDSIINWITVGVFFLILYLVVKTIFGGESFNFGLDLNSILIIASSVVIITAINVFLATFGLRKKTRVEETKFTSLDKPVEIIIADDKSTIERNIFGLRGHKSQSDGKIRSLKERIEFINADLKLTELLLEANLQDLNLSANQAISQARSFLYACISAFIISTICGMYALTISTNLSEFGNISNQILIYAFVIITVLLLPFFWGSVFYTMASSREIKARSLINLFFLFLVLLFFVLVIIFALSRTVNEPFFVSLSTIITLLNLTSGLLSGILYSKYMFLNWAISYTRKIDKFKRELLTLRTEYDKSLMDNKEINKMLYFHENKLKTYFYEFQDNSSSDFQESRN